MNQASFLMSAARSAVFSQTAATTGGHSGLGHVPGSALLGYAAGRLYTRDDIDAFLIFHSGKVRFLNACPVSPSGQPSIPVPLSFAEPKRSRGGVDEAGRLTDRVVNTTQAPDDTGSREQLEPLSAGYISRDLQIADNRREYRMKTAIIAGDRRAEDAQLFGYDILSAGRYLWQIEWDDDVPPDQMEAVLNCFTDHDIRLGRSAASEFGGAYSSQKITGLTDSRSWNPSKSPVILCLSDVALEDGRGAPAMSPTPDLFGLGPGRLVPEHSVIRTRRWSPWNRAVGRREGERTVIMAGSVLTFSLESDADPSHLCAGVGAFRQEGLGQVWVDSPLVAGRKPEAVASQASRLEAKQRPALSRPSVGVAGHGSPVVSTAQAQMHRLESEAAIEAQAEDWAGQLRRAAGGKMPRPAQWSRVAAAAASARVLSPDDGLARLKKELFTADNAICHETDESWKACRKAFMNLLDHDARHVKTGEERLAAIESMARKLRSKAASGKVPS